VGHRSDFGGAVGASGSKKRTVRNPATGESFKIPADKKMVWIGKKSGYLVPRKSSGK
jgi:predicted Rdx family selenoprotein